MELSTPAWKSEDEEEALRAVREITNVDELLDAILTAENWKVRVTALEKLSTPLMFGYVAFKDKETIVRKIAINHITHQGLLAYIAKDNDDFQARETAVEKLEDQGVLADIATSDEHWSVRRTAVMKLTNEFVLANIVQNDEEEVREAAVETLRKKFSGLG
jgi:hypothetical protein